MLLLFILRKIEGDLETLVCPLYFVVVLLF